ncbi:MAG: hypothetical protein M0003_08110 [Acidithiobacillus sp.]|nr:hypothetical protein [Acidithiobacillus sp.]
MDLQGALRSGTPVRISGPGEQACGCVGHYEMRYEIQKSTIYVLRLWHTREDR